MNDVLNSHTWLATVDLGKLFDIVYQIVLRRAGLWVLGVIYDLVKHGFVHFVRLDICTPELILINLDVLQQLGGLLGTGSVEC